MKNLLLKGAVVALFAVGANFAQAAGLCTLSTQTEGQTEGIDFDDVTFRGSPADDCYGTADGNDNAAAINGITAWYDAAEPWQALVKVDAPATSNTGSFGGLGFTLSATNFNPANNIGTFTLSWTDPPPTSVPLTLDLVAVLKAGPKYAAYLFNSEAFNTAPGSSNGTWEVVFTNKGGEVPNISHLSLYAREGTPSVPEPATLGMLGLGLLGMAAIRRRKLGLKS